MGCGYNLHSAQLSNFALRLMMSARRRRQWIFRLDRTAHHFREFYFEQRKLKLREIIDKVFAMQMIDFVLDDTPQNLFGFHLNFLEVPIEELHPDLFWANNLFSNPRKAQATLLEDGFALGSGKRWVDEDQLPPLLHARDVFQVNDRERKGLPHLICGQPKTIGIPHGHDEIFDQLLQLGGILLDLRSLLPQNGVIEGVNR